MKRVLVTVLDWGLGHATRCIPVIETLREKKCEVILAGSGDALTLLTREFPDLVSFKLPAYAPEYPKSGNGFVFKILTQLPKFYRTIQREHRIIEEIVATQRVDVVISDNRYGCWSSKVPSVFISHQDSIQLPRGWNWMRPMVRRLHHYAVRRFAQWWIPDIEGVASLTGNLVSPRSKLKANQIFIGHLSRFKGMSAPIVFDVCVLLSGPEPQRTIFEETILDQLREKELKFIVVRGVFSSGERTANSVDFASADELEKILAGSEIVICRSGYSTIMDLSILGKKAIFVPTPGQTEQEYLAKRFHTAGIAFSTSQGAIDLDQSIAEAKLRSGFPRHANNRELLVQAINNLLKT